LQPEPNLGTPHEWPTRARPAAAAVLTSPAFAGQVEDTIRFMLETVEAFADSLRLFAPSQGNFLSFGGARSADLQAL
jgi:hypothetical protein